MTQLIVKTKTETIKRNIIALLDKNEIEISDLCDLSTFKTEASFEDISKDEIISIECSDPVFIEALKTFPKNVYFELGQLLSADNQYASIDSFAKKDILKLRKLLELAEVNLPPALATKEELRNNLIAFNLKLSACKPGDANAIINEIKTLIYAYLKVGATHNDSAITEYYKIVKTRFSEESSDFEEKLLWLDESLNGAQLIKEMKKRKLTLLNVPANAIATLKKLSPLVSIEDKRLYISKHTEVEVIKALCADTKNGEVVDKKFLLKVFFNNTYFNSEVAVELLSVSPVLDTATIKKLAANNAQELLETGHISKDNLDEKLIKECGNHLLTYPWVFKSEKTLLSICKHISPRDLSVKELVESGFVSVRREVINRGTTSFLCACFSMFEPAEQAEIKARLLKDLKGSDSSNLLKIADFLSDAEFSKVAKTSAKTVDGAIEVLQESTSHKLRSIALARLLKSSYEKDVLALNPKFSITSEEYPQITEHIVKSNMSAWGLRNVSPKIFASNIDAFILPIQKLFTERMNINESKELIAKCSDEQLKKIFSTEGALINALGNRDTLGIEILARIVQCVGIDSVNHIIPSLDEDYADTMVELSKRVKIPDLNNFTNFSEALALTRLARGNAELAQRILDLAINEDSSQMNLNDIKRVIELDDTTKAHGHAFEKWALKNIDYISHLLNQARGPGKICYDEDAFNMAISSARMNKNKALVYNLVRSMVVENPLFILNDLGKYTDKFNLPTVVCELLDAGVVSKDNREIIEIILSENIGFKHVLHLKGITQLEAVELYMKSQHKIRFLELLNNSELITDEAALAKIYKFLLTSKDPEIKAKICRFNPILIPENEIDSHTLQTINSVETLSSLYKAKSSDLVVDEVINRIKNNMCDFTELNYDSRQSLLNAIILKMDTNKILSIKGFSLINPDFLTIESKRKIHDVSAIKLVGERFQAKYNHNTETIKIFSGSDLLRKAFDSKDIRSEEFMISSHLEDALSICPRGMTIELTGLCDNSERGGVIAKLDISIESARKTTEDLSREINQMIIKKANTIQQKAISEIPSDVKWFAHISFDKSASASAVRKGIADAENKTQGTFQIKTSPIIKNPQKNSWSVPNHGKTIISPLFSGEEGIEQMKCVFDRISETSTVKSVEVSFKTQEFTKIGRAHQDSLIGLTREMNSVIKASGVFSGAGQIWDEETSDTSYIYLKPDTQEIIAKFSGAFGDGAGLVNTIKVLTSVINQYIAAIKKEISSDENLSNISSEIIRNLDFENISQSEAKMKLLEAAKPLYRRGA